MTNRTTARLTGRAALVLIVLLVCACSSSAPSPAKATASPAAAIESACQQFFTSNGKSTTAKEDVAVASKKLNSLCPGAAS
jgi:hypothetical protein